MTSKAYPCKALWQL